MKIAAVCSGLTIILKAYFSPLAEGTDHKLVEGWRRTQSQSNLSPIRKSLLTGKFTGNFVESTRVERLRAPRRE